MGWGDRTLNMNVYQAAEKRILYVFSKYHYVDVGFSGGKDSISLLLVVLATMRKYNLDYKRLSVTFVDEEAIYPDVPDVVEHYRRMVLSLGARFLWLCLPWRHYNCTNTLRDEDSWTCWDIRAKDRWVRKPPSYALRWHPDFKYGMSYQEFFKRVANRHKNYVQLIGLRASESVQRAQVLFKSGYSKSKQRKYLFHVIYDWKDTDVWKIIKDNRAVFPQTYINLWKIGAKMRMSQIFAADTCQSIPRMLVFYPHFYERLERRCPNIDIVLLYYETRMFKSSSQDREHGTTYTEEDMRQKIRDRLKEAKINGENSKGIGFARLAWRKISRYTGMDVGLYMSIMTMIDGGDEKGRTYRAFGVALNSCFNKIYNGQGKGKQNADNTKPSEKEEGRVH